LTVPARAAHAELRSGRRNASGRSNKGIELEVEAIEDFRAGHDTSLPDARSLVGTMDQVRPHCAMSGSAPRLRRLAGLSSHRYHQVAATAPTPYRSEYPAIGQREGVDSQARYRRVQYAKRIAPLQRKMAQCASLIDSAVHEDGVVKRLADVGTEAVGSGPAELDQLTRQKFALYRDIVKGNRALLGAGSVGTARFAHSTRP
jgi:hypothetical protein